MASPRTLRQAITSISIASSSTSSSSSSLRMFSRVSQPSRPSPILSQIPRRWASQAPIPGTSSPPTPSTPSSLPNPLTEDTPRLSAPKGDPSTQRLGKIEPRLQMTFTCTANECGHRSTHQFAKSSYQKGIVLVQCPSCKNRHLIADHLGWFNESTGDGKMRTIEDILRAKGESIRKGTVGFDGDIEIDGEGKSPDEDK